MNNFRSIAGYDNTQPHEVYVFTARDQDGPIYVKIGMSKLPEARLPAIQTGCPIKIISGRAIKCTARRIAIAMEASMHEELNAYRCSGEWFRFFTNNESDSEALESAIDRHVKGMGMGIREVDLTLGYKLARREAKQRSYFSRLELATKSEKERAARLNVAPRILGVADTQ